MGHSQAGKAQNRERILAEAARQAQSDVGLLAGLDLARSGGGYGLTGMRDRDRHELTLHRAKETP